MIRRVCSQGRIQPPTAGACRAAMPVRDCLDYSPRPGERVHRAPRPQQKKAAVKLIVSGPGERIVGCHALGQDADEMMQGFAVALRLGATKRDFDETVAIHPTTAEELVTLRGPASCSAGSATKAGS